jgi:hypothetical protein
MTTMQRFTDINQVPEDQRETFLKVAALTQKLVDVANASGEAPKVVLTALLNTYINAGVSLGRLGECANAMLSVGGQIVLADAQAQMCTEQMPDAATTRH